jgi:hypothetical protein
VSFCRHPRKAPDLIAPPDDDASSATTGPPLATLSSGPWLRTVRTAVHHARTGGVRLVVAKGLGRLRRSLTGS